MKQGVLMGATLGNANQTTYCIRLYMKLLEINTLADAASEHKGCFRNIGDDGLNVGWHLPLVI